MRRHAPQAAADARCDRCDGKHRTERCPYYHRARGTHADEQKMPQLLRPPPNQGEGRVVRSDGRKIPQPPDGSCLFHALMGGVAEQGHVLLSGITTAKALRAILLTWLATHPEHDCNGTPLLASLRREMGQPRLPMAAYVKSMRPTTAYGGAFEILAFVLTQLYSVWVWAPKRGRVYERIGTFESPAGKDCRGT